MSQDLLSLVLLLFAKKRKIKGGIVDLWDAKDGSGRLQALRSRQLNAAPPQEPLLMVVYLHQRGGYMLHPLIDSRRYLHIAKFQSFIPLHTVVSPARIASLYVLSRLFPKRWRAIFCSAFRTADVSDRIAASIDRYNASFTEPGAHELIEISCLFANYSLWNGGQTVIGSRLLGLPGKEKQAYAYFSVVKTALTDETMAIFINSLRRFYFTTNRDWIAFRKEYQEIQFVDVSAVIRQFTFASS
jgi:hypothetical protein